VANDPTIVARPMSPDAGSVRAAAARGDVGEPTDASLCAGPPVSRWRLAFESVGLFAMGVLLMAYFYGPSPEQGVPAGLPGHDSFYHVKMAVLLPDIGLVDQFPWLRFVYFGEGDAFVSHHWGYHLLLSPFVHAANWMTGDYLRGGRWFACAGMGATFVLFNLLLASGAVRCRWLFWALLLALPSQFYLRHGYVRAINPSLVMMLLLILALFWNRAILAGVVLALYVQVYLGAVMYGPVVVIAFVASRLWCAEVSLRAAVRIAGYTFGGWLLGLLLHPYSSGVIQFLWLQVFGSGLSPDIEVGREWKPYEGVWWFAQFTGPVWAFWLPALLLRLRYGPRIEGKTMMLLVLKFAFLVLTLKARRFIEYWPLFALLSAGFLVAPVLARRIFWWPSKREQDEPISLDVALILYSLAAVPLVFAIAYYRDWITDTRVLAVLAIGVIVAGWPKRFGSARYWVRALAAPLFAFLAIGVGNAPVLAGAKRSTNCKYPLEEIKRMMAEIESQSEPGDLIFTDDWDLFPVFFYFNHHNHYAVGLDPKFTQDRRPDLWERYVRVTRGQTPRIAQIKWPEDDGTFTNRKIKVRLEDVRSIFGARFVVCDDEHQSLANNLASDKDLAERIYQSDADGSGSRYTVFRVLPAK